MPIRKWLKTYEVIGVYLCLMMMILNWGWYYMYEFKIILFSIFSIIIIVTVTVNQKSMMTLPQYLLILLKLMTGRYDCFIFKFQLYNNTVTHTVEKTKRMYWHLQLLTLIIVYLVIYHPLRTMTQSSHCLVAIPKMYIWAISKK